MGETSKKLQQTVSVRSEAVCCIWSEKMADKYLLSPEQVSKIQNILQKGDRVELIPVKDGIKIIKETREVVKGI